MSKAKRNQCSIKENIVEFGNYNFLRIDKFAYKQEITNKITIFLSYSTKDSHKFQIPQIAARLEGYPEIQKVYFWEVDMTGDMYEYMERNIRGSDYFLLFCSKNASNSIPVNKEWKAALTLKKKIIPVFDHSNNIPLFITNRGIQFKGDDLEHIINSILKLILKKGNDI